MFDPQKHDPDLFRLSADDEIPVADMSREEIQLRKLLNDFSRDPDQEKTLMGIARILMEKQLYDEALLYLDPYIIKVPDDTEALNYAGIIHFLKGDLETAETYFDRALVLDSRSRDALYNSAMLYSERGRFDKARERFQKLTEVEPDNPEIFNNLGAILYQEGKKQEAEDRFLQALDLDPENEPALRNIIEIMIETGRIEEAQSFFEAYQCIDPPEKEVEKLNKRLQVTREPGVDAPHKALMPLQVNTPSPLLYDDYGVHENSSGLRVGIVSDWCPGDRGELAWWLRWSLVNNGHSAFIMARTGKVPHCDQQERIAPPRYMGRWVVPNMTFSPTNKISDTLFDQWIKAVKPDVVLFVDETEPRLVEKVHAAGAAAIACPACIGAGPETWAALSGMDVVVSVSPGMREILAKHVAPEKLIPCDLGVDLNRFFPSAYPTDETIFLFDAGYGSVEELESLMIMLTAFEMMNREVMAKARLLIRSSVEWHLYPEEIRARGEGKPNIDFISGHVEDHHFLNMGDVLVNLKSSPGLYWIIPEAIASGVPSIVADRSPAMGWIYDEQMILRVPCRPAESESEGSFPAVDMKVLSDTLCTLASDREMVDYMGNVCREKARNLLDSVERSQALCDKLVTAWTAWRENAKAQSASSWSEDHEDRSSELQPAGATRMNQADLLTAIEKAITEGRNSEAKTLMNLYRQEIG
ncbi:MAG: tetratricopeptide repeat protein [Planctomycetota bacterium]